MHKGRGRPPKGDTALSNEIKIRLNDATLANIDIHAKKYNCTRAEAVRTILEGVFRIIEMSQHTSDND